MANPIALAMITLGLLLLVFGIFLVVKRRKAAGIVILVLGLGIGVIPFVASFVLAR
ncbi:MAG TPA: hypothetical protein VL334_04080 [Anaerolineae bacterium]|nr:hypothetical protein [Anaerolineae bacterium]